MLSPSLWPEAALTLARTFGVRGAFLRATHELRRITGRFRYAPRFPIESADSRGVFLRVDAERLAATTDRSSAIERAERIVAGEYEAFRAVWRPMPKTPEAWQRHPVTDHPSVAEDPWWKVNHLPADGGDIKDLWEPARFGWAYDLVRAYLVSGDERYARCFAEYFLSWVASSPPFRGVHWSCGQEASIRAAALLYAEANFGAELLARLGAAEALYRTIAATGERVADAIGYAISQRNNHAISEAMGLILMGVRLRGVHPEARSWIARGQSLLTRLIREQFAPDGWYIQHSFSYLRLAVDQCVLAERGLRFSGLSLSAAAVERLRATVRLLTIVMEPDNGIVPNHGPNDGAFVHPITLAAYRDYRPVITAAAATWGVSVPSRIELDEEVVAWLGIELPDRSETLEDGVYSGESGWAVARVGRATLFLRAGSYSSRPGHLDPLHVDLRVNGQEVIVDPGTYAYNAPAPWRNPLAGAAFHNGPMVDGREPGIRGPRFLWYVWPSARIVSVRFDGKTAMMVAQAADRVRRTIWLTAVGAEIRDELLARDAKNLTACWLLHPEIDACVVRSTGTTEVFNAESSSAAGWFSPSYSVKHSSRYVVVSIHAPEFEVTTRVSLSAAAPALESDAHILLETSH